MRERAQVKAWGMGKRKAIMNGEIKECGKMWWRKVKREAEKRERQSENVEQILLEIACKGM